MINVARNFVGLSVLLSAISCGKSASESATAAAVTPAISTNALFSGLASLSPALKHAVFTQLGAMTFPAYYQFLAHDLTNQDVNIDGTTLSGGLTRLEADRPQILAMQDSYANLGKLWASIGFNPETMTQADFSASVAASLGKAGPSLGLTADDDCRSQLQKTLGTTTAFDAAKLLNDYPDSFKLKIVNDPNNPARNVASSNYSGTVHQTFNSTPTVPAYSESTYVSLFASGNCKVMNKTNGHVTTRAYDPSTLEWPGMTPAS